MKVLKLIPNLLTLLNLFFGCLAIIFVVNSQFELSFLCVLLGIFFDFFDGFAARILKVQSELGKQLDSLADMVTSGVVPGLVMVQLLLKSMGQGTVHQLTSFSNFPYLAIIGFSITLASCYRLANFNIDENQKENFIGLPTPANTLFILSLPLIQAYSEYSFIHFILENQYVLLLIIVLSCYMLNAKIELFALKFKTFGFRENQLKYFFLVLCLLLIMFLKIVAVPTIIITYILLSVFCKKKK